MFSFSLSSSEIEKFPKTNSNADLEIPEEAFRKVFKGLHFVSLHYSIIDQNSKSSSQQLSFRTTSE